MFAASGAIGAIGGAAIAPITLASYSVGIDFGLKGFIAALFAGFRSPQIAVAGGIAIGVTETLAAGYVPPARGRSSSTRCWSSCWSRQAGC